MTLANDELQPGAKPDIILLHTCARREPESMDPTITSIAKKAGVSHSTVSRALADSPLTNAATKERIRRLAEEAGYRPHRVARSLVTGKTQTLGFVITNLKNPFFAELTDRLHRATR